MLDYLLRFLHNPCHVLQAILTPPADHNYYNLRDRPDNRQLPDRMSHLTIIVILLFGCRFARVTDCTDCIHFFTFYRLVYLIGVCMSVYNCGLIVVLLKRHLI